MKKIILIIMVFSKILAFSQEPREPQVLNDKLILKNTPNLSIIDSLVTKDANQMLRSTSVNDFKSQLGISNFLSNIVEDLTPQLGGNLDLNGRNITGAGNINTSGNLEILNTVKFTGYPSTRADVDPVNILHTDISGNLLSSTANYFATKTGLDNKLNLTGGTLTGDLIIDENGTTTNIAESIFTVKKESTLNATNVGQFIDLNRLTSSTPVDLNNNTIGLVSRVTNNSLFNDAGIIGGNFVSRHSGTNDFNFSYGSKNTSEYDGSGNGNFLIGNSTESRVIGTGTGIIDYNRGMSSNALINNPNSTVNFLQGYHNTIDLSAGTVGSASVSYLDIDGVGATVTGDLAYIRAGNDPLPTVNGSSYFIKSETTLPSEFAGDITALNFAGNGSQLTDVDAVALSGQNGSYYNHRLYGLGASAIVSGNWDNIYETGFYTNLTSVIPTLPENVDGLVLLHVNNSGLDSQTCWRVGVNKMWIRKRAGGVWSSWLEIYHTGNLDLSNYIEKAAFYEEGTFTPTLTDLGGGATYTGNLRGYYIRTGNKVTYTIDADTVNTTGTPTGGIVLGGFPFAVSTQHVYYAGSAGRFKGSDVAPANIDKISANFIQASNTMVIGGVDSGSPFSSVTFTSGDFSVSVDIITTVYTP